MSEFGLTEESPIIGNKYKIQSCISNGSFGYVFKGNHIKNSGETVAIKIEKNSAMKSLKHETKILNYLYSNKIRKIPAIYWYGLFDDCQCIVFTYYECSLSDYIMRKPLEPHIINGIMTKMVDIISQIHSKYVLHRDLKPSNFMIKSGDLFVIDFGLSTFYIDENRIHYPNEKSDTIIGSPKYISIRIFEGNKYSRRDDIISLAYIYMFMVLKDTPWEPTDYSPENVLDETIQTCGELNIDHPKNRMRYENRILIKFFEICGGNLGGNSRIFEFFEYIYGLDYEECPEYSYITDLFALGKA